MSTNPATSPSQSPSNKTARKSAKRSRGGMPRVAVVGAGAWGKNLVKNFSDLGALSAVVDPDEKIRAGVEQNYAGVTTFADFADALASDAVDAVAIASPVPMHFPMARDALNAGKDVFVEKPLTHTSADAETLADIAEQQGRILMAGHLLLYQPAIRWIKDYIDRGELGELYGIRHERLGLGRARPVENVLWDSGVHDMAVLLFLVGEQPGKVRASGHTILQPGIEDDVHVHLEFPNGMRANLHTSWLWPETMRRLIVRGSKGMLLYDEVAQIVTLHRKWISKDLQNCDEGSEVVYHGHGAPLRLECEHFLDRIRDRLPPLSDGRSAVEVIKVMETVSTMLEKSKNEAV